jgi:hypothetical protein
MADLRFMLFDPKHLMSGHLRWPEAKPQILAANGEETTRKMKVKFCMFRIFFSSADRGLFTRFSAFAALVESAGFP